MSTQIYLGSRKIKTSAKHKMIYTKKRIKTKNGIFKKKLKTF